MAGRASEGCDLAEGRRSSKHVESGIPKDRAADERVSQGSGRGLLGSEPMASSPWHPSGIITLLTDFGLSDPFVGVMKGVILGRFAAARIVDLTHGIAPQDCRAASFWLGRSFAWFPTGSVHVVVVDPGVGTERGAVVLRADDHLFVGPDNGVLTGVLERAESTEARDIDLARFDLPPASHTFHGRDVFAPVAAELASGRRTFDEVGEVKAAPSRLASARPRRCGGDVEGTVVTVDHFGNLITDLDGALMSHQAEAWVGIAGQQCPVGRTYADVHPGELLALVGSFGTLEVACRDGSAAAKLGVGPGAPVALCAPPKPARP